MPSRRLLTVAVLCGVVALSACDTDDPPPQSTTEAPGGPEQAADPPGATDEPDPDTSDPDTNDPGASDPGDPVAAGPITYVALGDSLATGVGATTSYVEEFADSLRTDTGVDVTVTNLAIDGWTSEDLLASLRDDAGVRDAVAGADLVTLDIGGNDVLHALPAYLTDTCGGDDNLQCLRDAATTFATRWDDILDELLALRDGAPAGILTLDLYQPFVGDERLADDLDTLRPTLDAVNAAINDAAAARGIPVAQVHAAFHGEDGTADPTASYLISVDGLHPSNAGHRLIADALLALDPGVPLPTG